MRSAIGSFCDAVLSIMLVPIIVFANRVVTAEPIHVRLVENNPVHVLTNVLCVSEGIFNRINLRASSLRPRRRAEQRHRGPMDGLCITRSLVAHRLAETLVTASGELWLRVPQFGIEDAFRQ
jgi:hypothetical protein